MQLLIGVLVIVIIILLRYRNHRNEAGYQKITADEAQTLINKTDNVIIIDVRRKDEYQTGHIENAICIPNETIFQQAATLLPEPSQKILVYCRSGNRSRQAANKLIKLGYQDVIDFGGIIDWHGEIVK